MDGFVFRPSHDPSSYDRAFFARVLKEASLELGFDPETLEVSINLVDASEIQALNRTHRQKDAPTDVLSFPLGDPTIPGYNKKILGDIFICEVVAAKDAQQEGMSLEQKMAWLTVHGFLHLVGHDHPDAEESGPRLKRRGEQMFALEDKILKRLKLKKDS